jgi:hypothetical protein
MIYRFKSQATGDLIMLGPQGDQLLHILGRTPAERGIIEVGALPAALAALQAAIAAEQPAGGDEEDPAEPGQPLVGLRQRLWPMVEMLRQCQAEGVPVVWGV